MPRVIGLVLSKVQRKNEELAVLTFWLNVQSSLNIMGIGENGWLKSN